MMLKHIRVVLAVTSIVLLSSCSLPTSVLPQSASGDPQPSETTQSHSLDGGDSGADAKKKDSFANRTVGEALEIGKFMPTQESQPAFNPCGEITAEQWASLGLRVNKPDDSTTGTFTTCSLRVIPEQEDPTLAAYIKANFNPLSKELKDGERLENVKIKKPSYVYLYSDTKPYRDICSAGTMTNQGRVTVSYGEFSNKVEPPSAEKTCQKAVDILEGIFNLPVLTPTAAQGAPAAPAPASQTAPGAPGAPTSTSAPEANPATTEKPADSASTGETFRQKLGVGKFGNDETVRKTFNPCKEITKAQWESLKFKVKNDQKLPVQPEPGHGDMYECFLASTDEGEHAGEVMKMSTSYLAPVILGAGQAIVNIKANKPDYIYFHDEYANLAEEECAAGVVTNRGRLSLTLQLGEKAEKSTKEQACQQAADRLMAISNLKAEGLDNVLHK